ncbi:MAG TPA: C4-dicarboxylate transporter DcuC [Gemmataceae bacterium]|nr:C4-dicarboxylate transporter DcuC [Gemmataceae bacterium]
MLLLAGLGVIVVAVWAIVRRVDVRLTLLLAALALGCLAGHPEVIVQKFLSTLVSDRFVIPIACSLGFVYVLRQTGCDQHLVHLLVRPIRRVRPVLIPGTIVVAAVVNVVVISQMSTAVMVGTVLVPLLRAARISPLTIGAALLLGSSIGGDLLNPGAPEVRTVSEAAQPPFSSGRWISQVLPLLIVELTVATAIFCLLSRRIESQYAKEAEARASEEEQSDAAFRINPLKALIPFVPIALLFLTSLPEPFRLLSVPRHWLVDAAHFRGTPSEIQAIFDSRLIGAAMLVGVAAVALTSLRHFHRTALTFFEGVGFAFARIISLIVAASCFGEGIKRIGLAALLGQLLRSWPRLLTPAAAALPMSFALLCGSGMATTQSLFGFFVEPAQQLGHDSLQLGAIVALAASAGRTLSPAAAVTLMCASLVEVNPLDLGRRLVIPLLAGQVAVLVASWFV